MCKTINICDLLKRIGKNILILVVVLILHGNAFVSAEDVIPVHKNEVEIVRIGVLAKRGAEICLQKWGPTADYLTSRIQGKKFIIVPIDFEDIYSLVEKGEVDFILANSSFYVELEHLYGVNRIATLKNLSVDGSSTEFAGVVFWKKNRTDLRQLMDLKDKKFMAVKDTSFGGWRMAWREFKEAGIDPYRDFKELRFGGTHDAVVYAVQDGTVDAGTVRSDTLESMQAEGKIDLKDFYVLPYHGKKDGTLPFLYSTRLYPEWPMAKVRHTSDALAEEVAIAMLEMKADSAAARSGKNAGWTIPLNYKSVYDCLRYLKIGPYKDVGKITLYEVIRNYWLWILGIFVMGLMSFMIFLHLSDLNMKLKQSLVLGEERERARVFLQTIIDTIPEKILVIDRDHRIVLANRNALLFEGEISDASLLKCHKYMYKSETPCDEKERVCPFVEVIKTKKPVFLEHVFLDEKGVEHFFEIVAAPLINEYGEIDQFVEIISDVTIRKKAEEELRKAKEKAEQVNEAKSEFLMNVSHDIRTPMNVINGFSELLMKTSLSKEQQKFCGMIMSKGKDLIGLIDDIVDISSVEKGHVRMHQSPFSMIKLIDDISHTVSLLIADKDIKFECNISDDIPERLLGDSMRLKQVLENLCVNAVKYTKKGRINLNVSIEDVNPEDNFSVVRFEVEDTGIGISRNNLPKIFDSFTRFYDIEDINYKHGVGMGLHIVSTLVKEMGGQIFVESEEGRGSKFYFSLKIQEPGVHSSEKESKASELSEALDGEVKLSGLNILVAEDDDATRILMERSFRDAECNLKFASDGEEVVEELKKNRYDLVLMDLRMPRMDGIEAARAIRKDIDKGIPILALTAHAMDFVEDQCMGAGMNGYLSKPVDIDKLKRAIKQYV